MTSAPAGAGRPRLRELRQSAGWTQQQLADKLAYLAWTRGEKNVGVNADMIAKWERGAKGISARYRALYCHLFGVTLDQLGDPTTAGPAPQPPARDTESLLSLVDNAAALLDLLGAPATALAPQLLAAWQDAAVNRRTMLGMLDPAATDPAGHARMVTATITDFEQLADRYAQLYATADPAALSHTVTAHVRAASHALRRDNTPTDRRRLLRNLTRVATLAGRLAHDDLGDPTTARAHYALAIDSAREAADHHATATALGHASHLALTENQPAAALAHLAAARAHAEHAPGLRCWLAALEATAHADQGDKTTARAVLDTLTHLAAPGASEPELADLVAACAHAHLRTAGHRAREYLTDALDQLPATARRPRILLLLDLATAELTGGDLQAACRHASAAAGLLEHTPYATGAARLRAFRTAAASHQAGPKILRVIDEHLAHTAA